MIGWLHLVSMIFYSPLRGMREVRERGSLAPIALISFISQAAYTFVAKRFAGAAGFASGGAVFSQLFPSAITLLLVAIVLSPLLTPASPIFSRRGSFRVVFTPEYAPVAATIVFLLTS